MSVKQTAQAQYQAIVDHAAAAAHFLTLPPEGWVRTVRRALGMSGAQLARRMNLTRGALNQLEHGEPNGAATIKSLEAAAKAMNCRFVYAIVPAATVAGLIDEQARKKAAALVQTAGKHMALEDQALAPEQIAAQIDRQAHGFVRAMPSDFWDGP